MGTEEQKKPIFERVPSFRSARTLMSKYGATLERVDFATEEFVMKITDEVDKFKKDRDYYIDKWVSFHCGCDFDEYMVLITRTEKNGKIEASERNE